MTRSSPEFSLPNAAEAFNDELSARFEQGEAQASFGNSERVELVPEDTFSLVPTAMYAYIKRTNQPTLTNAGEQLAPSLWLETHEPNRGVQSNFYAMGGRVCVQRFYKRPSSQQELQQALVRSPDGTLPLSEEDVLSPVQVEELFEWLKLAPPLVQPHAK